MHIEKMYKVKEQGIIKITGKVPVEAELIETMDILTAEENMRLIRISDNENVGSSIWLKDGDVQENYKEEEIEEVDNDNR